MRIGDMLRTYRHHQELSASEVAGSIGIQVNTLRAIETGTPPRARVKQLIIDWLTQDDLPPNSQQKLQVTQNNHVST